MHDDRVEKLKALRSRDWFGGDEFWYTGVQDPDQKAELSAKFDTVVTKFISACESSASFDNLLVLLKGELLGFERDSLETEDAEHLAGNFEILMDCVGLESSDGALNDWMYGFEV